MNDVVADDRIEQRILLIRGQKVMLDRDLADLYGVEVKALNRAVKRNPKRFPVDFVFQLNYQEVISLRCHFGTLNEGRGRHRKYLPHVFTEQGVSMLSSVLNSERAMLVNVEIMRTFVRLRQILASNADLARKLESLEQQYDAQFKAVFDAIRQLMSPAPLPLKRRIGFVGEVM